MIHFSPSTIIEHLKEEDFLHLKKANGKDKYAMIREIALGDSTSLEYKQAKYLAMQNALGVHNEQVQKLANEIMNNNFKRNSNANTKV